MPARELGDCGLFRRALRGPNDLYCLLDIRKKIQAGTTTSLATAFNMLESRNAEPKGYIREQIARMYEQICRTTDQKELAEKSKNRAVELYKQAAQQHRAAYLEILFHAKI